MTTASLPSEPQIPSMRRDIIAAYVAAGSRISAWALVSAIVYRLAGPAHFATLALIRGTIGILNYTSVGLSPALIRLFAEANPRPRTWERGQGMGPGLGLRNLQDSPFLSHASPGTEKRQPELGRNLAERAIFSTGVFVASVSAVVGLLIAELYARYFDHLHVVPSALIRQAPWAVIFIGIGTLLRLFSDTSGALLQVRGRIALDNYLLGASDILWSIATLLMFQRPGLLTTSITYSAAGIFLVIARAAAVARLDNTPWPPYRQAFRWQLAKRLLAFGSLVLVAQLAEYFYAPTDYILINHYLGSADVAAYAPGVQIDLGLLMLVTGLAAVLLPKSALAHAAGAGKSLRQYYLRGTLASAALLVIAASAVWMLYWPIFHLWFGTHPPNTRPILHLILIGTVVGGSSAVGRSVLIGMGRVTAMTAAAIIAGLVNVIASYCFVKYAGLGLSGILYGTLLAVIARCGVWMPWYVLRVLKVAPARPEIQFPE